jgi:hypothetical protein
MLEVQPLPPLEEILAIDATLTAEQIIELGETLRPLIVFQEFPDIALITLSDIYLPPHQRTMIWQMHLGAGTNVVVASRGTAKTSTVCMLYPNYIGPLYPGRLAVTLSATGLRGGQTIFLDAERWLNGGWDSQQQRVPYLRSCIPRTPSPIMKMPSFWRIEYANHAMNTTLPTKDPDAVRGTRAHDIYCDETNTMDREFIDDVVLPFLTVGTDMRHGGAYSKKNRIFFVSTIDYGWRPYQDRIAAAREGLSRDLRALEFARAGNWEAYDELDAKGLNQYTFTKFDYTDVLIRKHITRRDGRKVEVLGWPDPNIPLTRDKKGIPFSTRTADGRMDVRGAPVEYWKTYSVQKEEIEKPIRDAITDQASWLSEQRNISDTAVGDVYSNLLVSAASCEGDRCITPYAALNDEWRAKYKDDQRDYIPPVLYQCADPCVLGVDYAPQSDYCAFVVIRLGPLSKAEFNPLAHTGKTAWSNVIWAEQHQKMTGREAADKIRLLRERYNLTWIHQPHLTDTWEVCRAIGLDMRGGGTAVRDELAWISDEKLPEGQVRIYDPLDNDERIVAFEKDSRAVAMLDAIWPTDTLNETLVEFTKGQMEQGLLYIPKFLEVHDRPAGKRELHVGYEAARILATQLRKIRQEPTKAARRFYMEGDTEKDRNKKDFFSAFLYAGKQMRAHIIRQRQIDNTPPPLGGVIRPMQPKGPRRSPGARG